VYKWVQRPPYRSVPSTQPIHHAGFHCGHGVPNLFFAVLSRPNSGYI